MLTNSTATNWVTNEREDVEKYRSFSIPSKKIDIKAILKVEWIKVEFVLSYCVERSHLALIMSLTSIKMLTNMTHMQYHPI